MMVVMMVGSRAENLAKMKDIPTHLGSLKAVTLASPRRWGVLMAVNSAKQI